MSRYPTDRLLEEVAYIAYHFHWTPDQIMTMAHRDRQQWVKAIAQINQQLNQSLTDQVLHR